MDQRADRMVTRTTGLAAIVGGVIVALAGVRSWSLAPLGTRLLVPATLPSHRVAAFVIGLQFIVLGRGVLHRRWIAHRALTIIVFVGAVVNVVGSYPHRVLALSGLVVGVALVVTRRRYVVEADARRVQPALSAALGLCVSIAAGATLWVLWRHPGTQARPTLGHAMRAAGGAMAGADASLGQLTGSAQLAGLLMALTALVVLAVSIVVLAPHAPPAPDPADRRLVEGLLDQSETDGFAPFALRHDRLYAFSPDGRAALSYQVVSGVALFGGDPVGDPAAFDGAVETYLRRCAEAGWRPAGIGARGDRLAMWKGRGLRSLGIGDEAVVATSSFRLDTPKMRNVRQAAKRSANFGVTTEVRHEGSIGPAERRELLAVARGVWGGDGERGFSMNLDHVLDGERADPVVIVARGADGAAVGFQRYAMGGDHRVLSLDTMVRAPDAPNGVNERMIVDTIEWARAGGIERVSLNFAAFRALFETEHRTLVERFGYWGAHRLDRYIKVESLYRFNNKFRPEWVPRSVVLRSWVDVGWVALAAVQAEFDLRLPLGSEALADRSRGLLRALPWANR